MGDSPTKSRQPSFPDEDTNPVSRTEIAGFYCYQWASEVFVVCGIGSIIPIALEQLARDTGVLLSDKTTPCTPPPGLNETSVSITQDLPTDGGPEQQCIINFLGSEMNTASFAMYTFSISVFLQALIIISMSGAADHGRNRKSMLCVFGFVGSITTMLFLILTPNVYVLAALLTIVSNICFAASAVLMNSFLPVLVRYHPSVQQAGSAPSQNGSPAVNDIGDEQADDDASFSLSDSTAALLPGNQSTESNFAQPPKKAAVSAEIQLSTRLSGVGVVFGYGASVIVQVIAVFLVQWTGSLLITTFFIGLWWFVFTIPSALWLRPRPGPPLRHTALEASVSPSRLKVASVYLAHAWRSIYLTCLRARRLRDLLCFLAAWFLVSDGVSTISSASVLFAKTTLGMKPAALAFINVVTMVFGVGGAVFWPLFARFFRFTPIQTVLVCLVLFELMPIYGLLGYLPFVKSWGVLGLQQPWEMYPLGALFGIVLGGLATYCRAIYGNLIPPGSEAAFFALYAVTDKGSSVVGPAVVGAITDATGEIRPAFWFLAAVLALPIPFMAMVDVERGRRAGAQMSKELNGANDSQ